MGSGRAKTSIERSKKTNTKPPRTNHVIVKATQTIDPANKATQITELSTRDQIREDVMKGLQQLSKKQDASVKPLFEWTDYEFPSYAEPYFPDFMRQSLDDTPDMFTQEQLGKVKLRGIEKYLKRKEVEVVHKARGEEWLLNLDPDHFMFINIYDISLGCERLNPRELSYSTRISRSLDDFDMDTSIGPISNPPAEKLRTVLDSIKEREEAAAYSLWSFYLDGNPEDCPDYKAILESLPPLQTGDSGSLRKQVIPALQDSAAARQWYKDRLLFHLSDSVWILQSNRNI